MESLPSSFDLSLQISQETLPHMRNGLTEETARQIAEIVLRISRVDAVAITDDRKILAYSGQGCPHMQPGGQVQTRVTRQTLHSGQMAFVNSKDELQCPVVDCPCPIQTAVIAPLKRRDETVGTVKLFSHKMGPIPDYVQRLAEGVSQILSLQLEIEEADRHRELLAQARLEALQAQIRPHFLFNTLNTIIATSRFDPDLGRELLSELASFLRHTISYRGERRAVVEEVAFVKMYLKLEQARLGERLHAAVHVDHAALDALMPVLTLQPLVENAIVHGLAPKEGPAHIYITVRCRKNHLSFAVFDDGVGIHRDELRTVLEPGSGKGMGLGLANVNQRLLTLYGPKAGIKVHSRLGQGTVVSARIPREHPEEV